MAATRTWTRGGGTDAWATATNWGGTVPVTGDLVQINQTTGPIITTSVTSGEVRTGITAGTIGNFTISAGGVLTSNNAGNIGYFSGVTTPTPTAGGGGTVTITGTGSLWTLGANSLRLGFGINSTAVLNLSSGGRVVTGPRPGVSG